MEGEVKGIIDLNLSQEQRILIKTIMEFIAVEDPGYLETNKANEIMQKSLKLGLF